MSDDAQHFDLFADYDPIAPAWKMHQSGARFILSLCGRQSSKSFSTAKEFVRRIFQDLQRNLAEGRPYHPGDVRPNSATWWDRNPRLHYWVVGETYDLLDQSERYLLQTIPGALVDYANASEHSYWLKGDVLIELKSGKDPKRLVSVPLDGAWIDEAARLRHDAWSGYLRPTLLAKRGWCLATTTPLGQDWTYEAFEKPAKDGDPEHAFFTWPTVANTSVPWIVAEVEHARKNLPPQYFKREYEASREAFLGQIYDEFDEHTMVVDAVPQGVRFTQLLTGADWGFTAPGALVVVGITADGHVWALDEVYSASRLVEDFWIPEARKLRQTYRFSTVVGDPAEPDNLFRFRDSGIPIVRHANYGTGDFDEHRRSIRGGIRTMAALMHQGRFHVLRRCKNLIAELKSYRWNENKSAGVIVEEPAPHQKDHAATACRYAVSYAVRGAYLRPLDIAA